MRQTLNLKNKQTLHQFEKTHLCFANRQNIVNGKTENNFFLMVTLNFLMALNVTSKSLPQPLMFF